MNQRGLYGNTRCEGKGPNLSERRKSMSDKLVVDAVPMSVETVEIEDVELMEESFAASSDTTNNNVQS
jgi:hypothetical protein